MPNEVYIALLIINSGITSANPPCIVPYHVKNKDIINNTPANTNHCFLFIILIEFCYLKNYV